MTTKHRDLLDDSSKTPMRDREGSHLTAHAPAPGIYIDETPGDRRIITGVATSITAFLGRAARGPVNDPLAICGYGDYERYFGGLNVDYPLSYVVRDYFLNGGSQALIVRLEKNSTRARNNEIMLEAASPGAWGNSLVFTVDSKGITDDTATRLGLGKGDLFNLTIFENPGSGTVERFLNVAVTAGAGPRRLDRVLAEESILVGVQLKLDGTADLPVARPHDSSPAEDPANSSADPTRFKKFDGGADSMPLTADTDVLGDDNKKTGLYALAKADLFNLLCIPPDSRGGDTRVRVYHEAMRYCARRRAVLIVDSPGAWGADAVTAVAKAVAGLNALGLIGPAARNAALYFPRVIEANPQLGGHLDTFVSCGIVAGVMARTDLQRGVWKAPAGLEAGIQGIASLQVELNDAENALLNPLAINCLRRFPATGCLIWGARTLRGADQLADEYKYISVRRLALYIEESIDRGTQWVAFEPNDEPLWTQIRLNVGAFMDGLFRQGAFEGQLPHDAYFVKCGWDTMPKDQLNLGIVNIVVGFAPLKPAEFVVLQLQQMAGPSER
jgi:phage tail sheath protein FI